MKASTPVRAIRQPKAAPAKPTTTLSQALDQWNGDPDFMLSLARGLLALRAVADAGHPMSIAEVAGITGMPRATTRRCLYTLSVLDYVSASSRGYVAGPRLASLTSAYIGSSPLISGCQPILDDLRDQLQEGVSLGIYDSGEGVYVARAEVERRWKLNLHIGLRLPVYCSGFGRVLLAYQPEAEIDRYLATTDLVPMTDRTVTDPDRLREILAEVRRNGYAIGDQELEVGLRSISVPVFDSRGDMVAALTVGTQAAKTGMREVKSQIIPALMQAARDLSALT